MGSIHFCRHSSSRPYKHPSASSCSSSCLVCSSATRERDGRTLRQRYSTKGEAVEPRCMCALWREQVIDDPGGYWCEQWRLIDGWWTYTLQNLRACLKQVVKRSMDSTSCGCGGGKRENKCVRGRHLTLKSRVVEHYNQHWIEPYLKLCCQFSLFTDDGYDLLRTIRSRSVLQLAQHVHQSLKLFSCYIHQYLPRMRTSETEKHKKLKQYKLQL